MIAAVAAILMAQAGPVWDREVVLSSIADGKPLGRVEIYLKLLPQGGVRRKIISTFFLGAGKSYITDEEEWDGSGLMKSAVRRTRTGEESGQVLASFAEKKAILKFSAGGSGADEEVFDLPEGWERGEPALTWLTAAKPASGAVSRGARFDFDRMSWVQVTSTYGGPVEVTLRGQRLSAFLITDDLGISQWLDDKGLLIRQIAKDDAGAVTWERISSVVRK